MDNDKIIKPLMVAFNEDMKKNNSPSYSTDLIMITIKSLIPSEDNIGVNIDYNRYIEEIKLWKYYRHGENTSLINLFRKMDPKIYWTHVDDSIYPRILPIVLTNKDYSVLKEEVIKNVLFSTGNLETLIEAILLSKLLYLIILDEKNIIEKLKEDIINFSQVEFLEMYKDNFRVPIGTYEGKFQVAFEQNKIHALNCLNCSYSQYFKVLQDSIESLLNSERADTIIGKCISSCIGKDYLQSTKLDDYYLELSRYLLKLRKGRIAPEALKIEKYFLPDIFQFNEGDVFYHSLLNKSKVIKKEETDKKIIIHLKTKSGLYEFTK